MTCALGTHLSSPHGPMSLVLDSWSQLLGRAEDPSGFCKRLSLTSFTRWQQMPDTFFSESSTASLCMSLPLKRARRLKRGEGSGGLTLDGCQKTHRDGSHYARILDTHRRQRCWSELSSPGTTHGRQSCRHMKPAHCLLRLLFPGQISPCSVQSADKCWRASAILPCADCF